VAFEIVGLSLMYFEIEMEVVVEYVKPVIQLGNFLPIERVLDIVE